MAENSLQELLIDELRDLYDAENQIVKALPKMASKASSEELRSAFEEHLEQTEEQVDRLKRIFKQMEEKPEGKKCKGMQGLLDEGSEAMGEFKGGTLDAAMIGAAQRVEHYEIAAYGTARALAEVLGKQEIVSLLEETLEEEKETDEKLTEIAETVNSEAAERTSGESEEKEKEEGEQKPRARRAKAGGRS